MARTSTPRIQTPSGWPKSPPIGASSPPEPGVNGVDGKEKSTPFIPNAGIETVRVTRPSDAPRLLFLMSRHNQLPVTDREREWLRDRFIDPDALILVLTRNSEVVGYMVTLIGVDSWGRRLGEICQAFGCQGHGIGMFEESIEWARERGVERVRWVDQGKRRPRAMKALFNAREIGTVYETVLEGVKSDAD